MSKRSGKKSKTSAVMPRFDVGALREFAGDKVFSRGVVYHQDGQVELVAVDKARVLAKVLGSEIYRTELQGKGRDFSGECSCPAFSDWGFCKHLVATALAANAVKPDELTQATNRFERIRRHLQARGVDGLVELVMELAERDSELLNELELSAVADTADDKTLFAQFKKAITQATRINGFVEYGEVRSWARGIESVLDRIENLVECGRAETVLRLLNYFFARMDSVLASLDDSNGHGGGVYARARDIHLAACLKAKPDPLALARDLFAREIESDWDFFEDASAVYGDVLGESGLAEYRRLAAQAWQGIKPRRAGDRRVHDDEFGTRYRLGEILEDFAERDGDVDARIAIRTKDLSSAYAYLGIAQLCLDHGREAEALRWADEGLWQFEDEPDERLVFFAVDLYRRRGRTDDADKLLWRTFERLPSIELYRRLKVSANADLAAAGTVRDRAVALLRAKIGKPWAAARWSTPVDLLLQLLMSEKLVGEAWEIVWTHGCGAPLLEAMAKASENSHPFEALKAYAHRVEQLVGLGGQTNYADARAIIARMHAIRTRLGEDSEHLAYVADLARRHKAKRNFMKLLQTAGHS
jgi:uncharacterized Zn finger protein